MRLLRIYLNSFYTPKIVIDGVYSTLSEMGFKNGNILEPSMGVGNFIGNLPDEMSKSKFYGVELDSVSGRIAKLLYPESDVQVKGFEETSFQITSLMWQLVMFRLANLRLMIGNTIVITF